MKANKEEILKLVDEGWIDMKMHKYAHLKILNYTKECQYAKHWNPYTEMCRGLIVDDDWNIVSRPFMKFYNDFEIEDKSVIPNEPFEVYEKLDGSLGILYWADDVPMIATRGSFESEQAVHATNLLQSKYSNALKNLKKDRTYLFEIIYPEDHHVVCYNNIDDIFLLAVIDTETGMDYDVNDYRDIGFPVVRKFNGVSDYNSIKDMFKYDNNEGFVVKFKNGFRMKVKFQEYFRLASLVSGLTEKRILELMSNGDTGMIEELRTQLDEENLKVLEDMVNRFSSEYSMIEDEAKSVYREFNNDKDAALYFNTQPHRPILFMMRKGRPYSDAIWKEIKNNLKCS